MPRSNRPKGSRKREEEPELAVNLLRIGYRRTEIRRGVEYIVQSTNGQSDDPGKSWICPHCHITITPGTTHLVAWDELRGVQTRRHFHNNCWKAFNGSLT